MQDHRHKQQTTRPLVAPEVRFKSLLTGRLRTCGATTSIEHAARVQSNGTLAQHTLNDISENVVNPCHQKRKTHCIYYSRHFWPVPWIAAAESASCRHCVVVLLLRRSAMLKA